MHFHAHNHPHHKSPRRPFLAALCCALLSMALAATTALARTNFPETEPNDNKSQASPALGMTHGDAITGISTGGAGAQLDYFLVKTAPLPFGIYRHMLTLTTPGTAGHTGYIRGLSQTGTYPGPGGTINAGTDVQVAASGLSGNIPPRSVMWYGFGKEEQLYHMIGGTAGTTQPYFSTLNTTQITPGSTFRTFAGGNITITSIGQGHSSDTHLAVFDSDGNAIPGYSNDQNSTEGGGTGTGNGSILTRTFAPGTYYLALSNWNLATNQASPFDERSPSSNVLDFANVAVNSQITEGQNLTFSIIDSLGSIQVPASKFHGYEILWFRIDVDDADAVLTASGSANPATLFHGESTLITVAVTPASAPASTDIEVTADLTPLGGPSAQQLYDDGTNGDATADDGVYSYLATVGTGAASGVGPVTVTFIANDAQGRAASGNLNLTLYPTVQFSEREPNDDKTQANIITGLAAGDTLSGTTTGSTGANLDYFRIKLAPAPTAIYRHHLRLTTQSSGGHTGSIRGLTQSGTVGVGGAPVEGSDATAQTGQTSATLTLPPRTVRWYGFGKEEELYYRVAGSTSTPMPYFATLFTDVITPSVVPGNFAPGAITITTVNQGHNTSTHLWVYDSDLNAIPTYGNRVNTVLGGGPGTGSQSHLVRNYKAGTYYLAITTVTFASDQPAAFDDGNVASTMLDFPNIAVNTGSASFNDITFSIIDSKDAAVQVPALKDEPFQIHWYKFIVGDDETPIPGDINGDGIVDVDDLLLLLQAWGECPSKGDCPADLAPPPNGDGEVNVDDLLILLQNWT